MPLNFKKKENKKYIAMMKRYWPWLCSGLFFLLIVLLLSPYIFRPWTKYPAELKADIAWRQFQATFSSSCRESCLAMRQAMADIWRPYFKQNQELASVEYERAFSEANEEFQSALIKIMAADMGRAPLPPVLADYIARPEASGEIKRQIVISFPEAFADEDWLRGLRLVIVDETATEENRVYALKLLSAYPDAANIALVKEIILRENIGTLTPIALQVASIWPINTIHWSQEDVEAMLHLIGDESDKSIRWRRLWLLCEITKGQDDVLRQILSSIAMNSSLDNITRGLAAETLRTNYSIVITTPKPTSADWQEYYEKI